MIWCDGYHNCHRRAAMWRDLRTMSEQTSARPTRPSAVAFRGRTCCPLHQSVWAVPDLRNDGRLCETWACRRHPTVCPVGTLRAASARNRLPVPAQMLRRAPGHRLRRERGIVRAAGAHHRGAEDAEVWHLVREAEAVLRSARSDLCRVVEREHFENSLLPFCYPIQWYETESGRTRQYRPAELPRQFSTSGYRLVQKTILESGLGNRCSIRLSYGTDPRISFRGPVWVPISADRTILYSII